MNENDDHEGANNDDNYDVDGENLADALEDHKINDHSNLSNQGEVMPENSQF